MKKQLLAGLIWAGVGAVTSSGHLWAQADPTALQKADLSFFGAGTGTYTGLDYGRNAGITAGVTLSIKSLYGFRPGIELRGNYPIDGGNVDSQKSVLIGPRISRTYGRFRPYADAFFGRGQIDYNGGFIVGNFRYDRTTTNIYAGGGGLDFRVTPHFDLKGEVQFERWSTPVVSTGVIYVKPISIGVVYHLDFNRYGGHRRKRDKANRQPPPPASAP